MVPLLRSPHTRVTRRIDADPTSTALLLAGPTAVDLWPGVRRVGEMDGRVLVEAAPDAGAPDAAASAPDRRTLVTVDARPPRRTPTAYVTRFSWCSAADRGELAASGRLTLAYAPTGDGTPVTHAVLEVDAEQDAPSLGEPVLTRMAEGFLANLARAAELRNRAA